MIKLDTTSQDWQDIETAPKGKKAILLWCPTNRCTFICNWDDERECWIHFGGFDSELNFTPAAWAEVPRPDIDF